MKIVYKFLDIFDHFIPLVFILTTLTFVFGADAMVKSGNLWGWLYVLVAAIIDAGLYWLWNKPVGYWKHK
jgi:hypothetical protein